MGAGGNGAIGRKDFAHWISVPTRWRDMDAMRHVNSAVYFTYLEAARMEYFRGAGLHTFKIDHKEGPAVISQTCNYRRQVFHPAVLEIGTRLVELKEKTFTVEYEVYFEGTDTLVCDGSTTMAWVDYERARGIPLPDALRKAIEEYEGRGVTAV